LPPGTGDKAFTVPVPCARPRSTSREAVCVAWTKDEHRLLNVRPNGSQVCAVVARQHELPRVSCEAEDDPARGPAAAGNREGHDHRLAARADKGSAKHLANRLGHLRVIGVAQVEAFDELTGCCPRAVRLCGRAAGRGNRRSGGAAADRTRHRKGDHGNCRDNQKRTQGRALPELLHLHLLLVPGQERRKEGSSLSAPEPVPKPEIALPRPREIQRQNQSPTDRDNLCKRARAG
jgi:hypothetical protein